MIEDIKRMDIVNLVSQKQDKFFYYLTGLNVASIGFTLSKTFDMKSLNYNDFCLCIALLSWMISIGCALYWHHTVMNAHDLQLELYDLLTRNPDKKNQKEETSRINKKIEKKSEKAGSAHAAMVWLFIIGVLTFVVWRIVNLL